VTAAGRLRVLVAGARGGIGGACVELLRGAGHQVVGVDRGAGQGGGPVPARAVDATLPPGASSEMHAVDVTLPGGGPSQVNAVALHRWLDSPRVVKQVDYGPRWRGHHVLVQASTDLDNELRAWLQEAHDVVGLQADLPQRPGRRPRTSP
jgi:hypothetical protein